MVDAGGGGAGDRGEGAEGSGKRGIFLNLGRRKQRLSMISRRCCGKRLKMRCIRRPWRCTQGLWTSYRRTTKPWRNGGMSHIAIDN